MRLQIALLRRNKNYFSFLDKTVTIYSLKPVLTFGCTRTRLKFEDFFPRFITFIPRLKPASLRQQRHPDISASSLNYDLACSVTRSAILHEYGLDTKKPITDKHAIDLTRFYCADFLSERILNREKKDFARVKTCWVGYLNEVQMAFNKTEA